MSKACAADVQGLSSKNSPHDDYLSANVTNGGRSLNAIWKNKNFDTYEKAFLNAIGSMVDFRGDFMDQVTISVPDLAEMLGCSVRKVQSVARKLEGDGYIKIRKRADESGNKLPSAYRLTWKVFSEEKQRLREVSQKGPTPPGARHAPPLVHSVPISSPKEEEDYSSSSEEEEKRGEKNSLEGRKVEEEVKKTEGRNPPPRVLSPIKPKVDDRPPEAVYIPPTEDTPEFLEAAARFSQSVRQMREAQARAREAI